MAQDKNALSEADRLRQVLDVARDGLRFAQWFQAIGKLPDVVAACDEAFSAVPGLANEIGRLSGQLDVIEAQLKIRQNEATEIYAKLAERNRVAEERASTAEANALTAEESSLAQIAESRRRADEAIHKDEERVANRERALKNEIVRLETEHQGRKNLFIQREREAREQAELAEERLRELAASIPVPGR